MLHHRILKTSSSISLCHILCYKYSVICAGERGQSGASKVSSETLKCICVFANNCLRRIAYNVECSVTTSKLHE